MTNVDLGLGFVIFLKFLSLLGSQFVTFFGYGLRFGGEGRPGSEESAKRYHLKIEARKDPIFCILVFYVLRFPYPMSRIRRSNKIHLTG